MKIFFSLFTVWFSMAIASAQAPTQKEVVEQFISSILQTDEGDFPSLWTMLKITKPIPEDEGGMEKINEVFALLKKQLENHPYEIVTSQEAFQFLEAINEKRTGDVLHSDQGTVFYIYLPEFRRFLVRSPIVINPQNEIIAIFTDYCSDNKICLRYL